MLLVALKDRLFREVDFLRRPVQLEGANKRRVTRKGGSNGNDT